VGEQDVGGDHHRLRGGTLGDPVVGGVEPATHHHALHKRADRHAERAVADHADRRRFACGDPVDFLLHRAGVGVDENAQRCHAPPVKPPPGAGAIPAYRLRTNSARSTSPLIPSYLQSISCASPVRRIDLISVPRLSVCPAPLTSRSLISVTWSPSASRLPTASRTSTCEAAARFAASSEAGIHSPLSSS